VISDFTFLKSNRVEISRFTLLIALSSTCRSTLLTTSTDGIFPSLVVTIRPINITTKVTMTLNSTHRFLIFYRYSSGYFHVLAIQPDFDIQYIQCETPHIKIQIGQFFPDQLNILFRLRQTDGGFTACL
jgi:hypothetical protein